MALAWSLVAIRTLSGKSSWEAASNQLEPWSRLLLCVPAGLTAAFGLWTPAMPHADLPARRHSRYLRTSAVILGAYALLAGLDLPALGVGPFSPPAAGQFVSGLPAIVFARFVCGALLAVFLSLALSVDVGRTQASLSLLQVRQDFASLVNHELRSSLQAIMSASEMLSRTPPAAGTETLERLVRVIHSNASAMGLLLSDLSQGAVVDVRDLGMRMEPVDVREVIEEAADWFRTTANDHALEMRLADQPIRAQIDRMRIEQVLKNLLSNASKYSSPGTPIAMELSVEPSQISIAVENRGQGIQSSEIPHVFSRAYRTEAGKGRTRGAGLGLYIARAIVEAHGGRIYVDSIPDEITRFWFTLPLAASSAPPSGNGPAADGGLRPTA